MSDDDFCEHCGIRLDLHYNSAPDDDRDEQDCEMAERKVAISDAFFAPFMWGAS